MNRELILYIFFGVLTTIVNFITYLLILKINKNYIFATTLAFITAIIFAYITNKKYVFEKKTSSLKELLKEFIKFLTSRAFTYFVDVLGMIFLIKYLSQGEISSKIIVNITVVILNYLFSKLYIFKTEK
ncbi:GtrA family protein [uncultured Ilyobacter sp.]|uniref:GtrA family protein n=1 Tax=uncultured Ilyobacter sp. TaxID=544433 RepID=UPI0029F5C3DE|nr:GtrA family protein [uncultured Ilyobacter sp.]